MIQTLKILITVGLLLGQLAFSAENKANESCSVKTTGKSTCQIPTNSPTDRKPNFSVGKINKNDKKNRSYKTDGKALSPTLR